MAFVNTPPPHAAAGSDRLHRAARPPRRPNGRRRALTALAFTAAALLPTAGAGAQPAAATSPLPSAAPPGAALPGAAPSSATPSRTPTGASPQPGPRAFEGLVVATWPEHTSKEIARRTARLARLVHGALEHHARRPADGRILPAPPYRESDAGRVTEELRRELHRCIDSAIVASSEQRRSRARERIDHCRALVSNALHRLIRDESTAPEVLDSCLVMVRTLLESRAPDARERAFNQARACRIEALDVRPTERRHTSALLRLFREVDRDIDQTGGLLVARHEDPSCQIRVNGRPIGKTPAARRVPAGIYRIEAQCDSGIWDAPLTRVDGRDVVRVRFPAPRLPGVYHTDEGILTVVRDRLRFPQQAGLIEKLLRGTHARYLVSVSPRRDTPGFELGVHRAGRSDFTAVDRIGQVPAQQRAIRIALEPLLSRIPRAKTAAAAEPPSPALQAAPGGGLTDEEAWGTALTIGGGLSLATGLGLIVALYATPQSFSDLQAGGGIAFALTAAGSLAISAAVPLWLPQGDGTWSTIPAALGAFSAAIGFILLSLHDECVDNPCQPASGRRDTALASAGIIWTSAPLLSPAITYLVRALTRNDAAQGNAQLGPHGARLTLGWSF